MLRPELVAEVKRLIAHGRLSQRAIARETGVSRGTVGNIYHGRRPDYPIRRGDREEDLVNPLGGPRARCPDCGADVVMPCQACRARAYAERRRRRGLKPPPLKPAENDFGAQLTPAERERLEEVRRQNIPPELYEPLDPPEEEEGQDAA